MGEAGPEEIVARVPHMEPPGPDRRTGAPAFRPLPCILWRNPSIAVAGEPSRFPESAQRSDDGIMV